MDEKENLTALFLNNQGIVSAEQLNQAGITNYQIRKLLSENKITRIRRGNYLYNEFHLYDYEIIASLFPEAILYPKINAHFIEEDLLEIGVMEIETYLDVEDQRKKIVTKIYDKDKMICDVIKHQNKIDQEVFNQVMLISSS